MTAGNPVGLTATSRLTERLDALGFARRGPGTLARFDRGLLAPAPQRVWIDPDTLPDADHRRVQRQRADSQDDEWDGADRRYFSERSMKLLDATEEEVAIPELAAA